MQPFGHNRHGPKKLGRAAVPLWVGGAGSPSNTKSLGPRPTSVQVASWSMKPFGHNTRVLQTTDSQTTSHDNSRTLHCNGRLKILGSDSNYAYFEVPACLIKVMYTTIISVEKIASPVTALHSWYFWLYTAVVISLHYFVQSGALFVTVYG